ncbi:hypothetical protein K456DRAFT_1919670 [Colletotrichum gloeosporioides 23]|nr:hypothetical protein K456DRAFT_1919670 [Colletotrichum gloeosporioides 23]
MPAGYSNRGVSARSTRAFLEDDGRARKNEAPRLLTMVTRLSMRREAVTQKTNCKYDMKSEYEALSNSSSQKATTSQSSRPTSTWNIARRPGQAPSSLLKMLNPKPEVCRWGLAHPAARKSHGGTWGPEFRRILKEPNRPSIWGLRLTHLCDDLIIEIIGHLGADRIRRRHSNMTAYDDDAWTYQRNLINLSQTCSRFRSLVGPYAWHTLHLSHDRYGREKTPGAREWRGKLTDMFEYVFASDWTMVDGKKGTKKGVKGYTRNTDNVLSRSTPFYSFGVLGYVRHVELDLSGVPAPKNPKWLLRILRYPALEHLEVTVDCSHRQTQDQAYGKEKEVLYQHGLEFPVPAMKKLSLFFAESSKPAIILAATSWGTCISRRL